MNIRQLQLEVQELRNLIKNIIINNIENKAITRLVIVNIQAAISGLYIIYDIGDTQLYRTVIKYDDLIKAIDDVNWVNINYNSLRVVE